MPRPAAVAPESSRRELPGRRRALVALLILAPFAVAICAEMGAAAAVAGIDASARDRRAAGDYAHAVAAYHALALRQSPLYGLNRAPINEASGNADATLLTWADALARAGRTDQALSLVDQIHQPSRTATPAVVARVRAQIVIDSVRAAAGSGDQLTAIARTRLLASLAIPSDLRRQADTLTNMTELAATAQLIAARRPVEAVAALDDVIRRGAQSADARTATEMLPNTLLIAGKMTLSQFDFQQAGAMLRRLVAGYPSSAEAQFAETLLTQGQNVVGTVVRHDGTVSPGPVRLAAHFVVSARGDYALGPYYDGNADENGDFTIAGVPIGGPYVLEVNRDGGWVAPVDRATGQSAYPATIEPLTPVDLTFVVLPS